ncbi:MAG: DUF4249 family protein [Bacteroidetes bacterium]|nr:DUF4249 family protein [Bacteroidota bacterium]
MKPFIPFVLCCTFLFGACDSVGTNDSEDLLVVEAFLFAGEDVDDINLSTTILLSVEDPARIPVTDAVVRLEKSGVTYELASRGDDGNYHYAGDDLVVETGDVFRLRINYHGTEISAVTEVPPPPTGTRMSTARIAIPSVDSDPFGLREFIRNQDNAFSVTWDNPTRKLHFVAVRSPDSDSPDYILPEFIRERFTGFELLTEPTTANFFDIRLFQLEIFGSYSVTVYRINQEYADLYESREQDSRDLNEPLSNIEGGLGVFSAFNGQITQFEIIRE